MLVEWSITVLVTYGSDMFNTSTVQKVIFKELIVFLTKEKIIQLEILTAMVFIAYLETVYEMDS